MLIDHLRLVSNQGVLDKLKGYNLNGINYSEFTLREFVKKLRPENLILFDRDTATPEDIKIIQDLYEYGAKHVVAHYNFDWPPSTWKKRLGFKFRMFCDVCGNSNVFAPFPMVDYQDNMHKALRNFPYEYLCEATKHAIDIYHFFMEIVNDLDATREHLRDYPFCATCFWQEEPDLRHAYKKALVKRKEKELAEQQKEAQHIKTCLGLLNQYQNAYTHLDAYPATMITILKMVIGSANRYGLLCPKSATMKPLVTIKARIEATEYAFILLRLRLLVDSGVLSVESPLPDTFANTKVEVNQTSGNYLVDHDGVYEGLSCRYHNKNPNFPITDKTLSKFILDFDSVLAYQGAARYSEVFDVLDSELFNDVRAFVLAKTKEVGLTFDLNPKNVEALEHLHKNYGVVQAFSIVVYVLRSAAYDILRKEYTKDQIEKRLASMFIQYGQECKRSKTGPLNKDILDKHFSLSDLSPSPRSYLVDVLGFTAGELYTQPLSLEEMKKAYALHGSVKAPLPNLKVGEGDLLLFPTFES